jgi:type VI protein secretion system component VasK
MPKHQFAQQIRYIDILGEPENSPIRTMMERIAIETNWDNPVVQAELAPKKALLLGLNVKCCIRVNRNCHSRL